jgi:hypothetical protein
LSTSMSKARKWIRELAKEGPHDLLE